MNLASHGNRAIKQFKMEITKTEHQTLTLVLLKCKLSTTIKPLDNNPLSNSYKPVSLCN